MSILTEFTVPAEDFVLAEAFAAAPEITVEMERIVPTERQAFPLFFAWDGHEFAAFEAAVRDDSAIADLTRIEEFRDGRLYRAEWSGPARNCRDVLLDTRATLLQAVGTCDEWWFEIRFPDAEHAAAFQAAAQDRDIPFELEKLAEVTAKEGGTQYGLTLQQRETVVRAYEEGYFEEPRDITLQELADEFDRSPGAVSGRLRRGICQLIASTLATGE